MPELLSLLLQLLVLALFGMLIWSSIKQENWHEKFIKNKQAKSLLIVFVLIFVFVYGITLFFDVLFPIETLTK